MALRLAVFRGPVSCRREAQGPLGLTLAGRADGPPDELLTVAFAGEAPADLPATLADAVLERDDAGVYRIVTAAQVFPIYARAIHLHREVGRAFYRAIPPRRVPVTRRLLWRSVLALAARRLGVVALRAMRR